VARHCGRRYYLSPLRSRRASSRSMDVQHTGTRSSGSHRLERAAGAAARAARRDSTGEPARTETGLTDASPPGSDRRVRVRRCSRAGLLAEHAGAITGRGAALGDRGRVGGSAARSCARVRARSRGAPRSGASARRSSGRASQRHGPPGPRRRVHGLARPRPARRARGGAPVAPTDVLQRERTIRSNLPAPHGDGHQDRLAIADARLSRRHALRRVECRSADPGVSAV
jgi:hypothetical protein